MFSVRLYDPNDVPIPLPPGVTVLPRRWSAQATGGCDAAEIRLESTDQTALLAAAGWLGYRLEIVNARGSVVWWGDVVEVEVAANGLLLGTSLRGLANKVMVYYSRPTPGGQVEAAETDWETDDVSIAQYGTWERRVTGTGYKSDADAERLRDTILTRTAYPAKTLRLGDDGRYAMVRCQGFWHRLARIYYQQDAGLVEYSDDPTSIAPGSGGSDVQAAAYPLGLGFTSSLVAFEAINNTIQELEGKLSEFPDGIEIAVTGSTSNNGAFTVSGVDDMAAYSITATTISFDANDDIADTGFGLNFVEPGHLIQVSGSTANSGTHYVKNVKDQGNIEVSPSYNATITSEAAGPSVTIKRGNILTVDETITSEQAGDTVTVLAYGQKLYQPFTITSGAIDWTVKQIELSVRAVNSPGDSLRVRLYEDNAGEPGTLLETVDLAAGSLATGACTWTAWTFANTQALDDDTTYGLEISRTGSPDWFSFYEVSLDGAGGYTGGTLLMWDGAAWQTPAVTRSLLFRVLDAKDTAQQISRIALATGSGVFGSSIEATSSILSNQYRDGQRTAMDEVVSLADMGTSTGARLLVAVTASEVLRIFAEPIPNDARFVYTMDKRLKHYQGSLADEGLVPVGEWVHVDNSHLLPAAWASVSPFFVERAEYTAGEGLMLEPEANDNYDLGLEGA